MKYVVLWHMAPYRLVGCY